MNNENYPTWLVPINIAKELKEIGFDEPCNHYVRISNDNIKLKINHSSIGLVILKRNSEYLNDDIASFVTIPTWTDVFAWFRAKGYYGNLEASSKGASAYIYAPFLDQGTSWDIAYKESYEEAREALLLKLIDLYKAAKQ